MTINTNSSVKAGENEGAPDKYKAPPQQSVCVCVCGGGAALTVFLSCNPLGT